MKSQWHWLQRQLMMHKVYGLLVTAWLFLSLTQTLHFHWYYDQSWWDSVRWSVRDWLVWFVLFAVIYRVCAGQKHLTRFSFQSVLWVAVIALTSGVLQTLIITSLDFIAGTASRPFWEDFTHFYAKRWLQYLFFFAVFWLLMLNRFFVQQNAESTPSGNMSGSQRIQVNDGKQHHWLEPEQIISIESAGNYLCFHTLMGELISRGTLKSIQPDLDPERFTRISRSRVVNQQAIVRSHRINRSRVDLVLSDGSIVTIGPTYWRAVKARLNL